MQLFYDNPFMPVISDRITSDHSIPYFSFGTEKENLEAEGMLGKHEKAQDVQLLLTGKGGNPF